MSGKASSNPPYHSRPSSYAASSLDPATGRRSRSDTALRSIAQRTGSTSAEEAPYIIQHGGYYVFVSWDLCCQGTKSTYRVMVGRSTSITGPYTGRAGVRMTAGGGTQILAQRRLAVRVLNSV
ncbi:family 43 glycosylhydrolase [Amycolatopsis sp. NPDC004625]|uniref:family 43 glycosylhydrolase n=1 Tax=Amycolatopsis sp. NPDC004625 TaxID=3154670 RepID=UPI0033B5A4E3